MYLKRNTAKAFKPDKKLTSNQDKCSIFYGNLKKRKLFLGLMGITLSIFLFSLSVGKYHVPPLETLKILLSSVFTIKQSWSDQMQNVVLNMRLPRLCIGLLTGMALSLSGATYQSMFKNPLVSPDLLGVSAGACVGAALAIILHLNSLGVQLMALFFGLLAVFLTMRIPHLFKNDSSLMLVLSGVIVGGFMNSLLGIFKYVADPEQELASIVYWTMGSFASIKAQAVIWTAPPMLLSATFLLLIRWRINLLSLGDKEAKSLGLNVKKIRGLAILCATILTACAVCLSGTISWIGLIIPHAGRLLVGHDNRYLLPASAILGGAFMILVDTLARTLTGSEIPLSILTGFLGAPLFIWLLVKQRMKIV